MPGPRGLTFEEEPTFRNTPTVPSLVPINPRGDDTASERGDSAPDGRARGDMVVRAASERGVSLVGELCFSGVCGGAAPLPCAGRARCGVDVDGFGTLLKFSVSFGAASVVPVSPTRDPWTRGRLLPGERSKCRGTLTDDSFSESSSSSICRRIPCDAPRLGLSGDCAGERGLRAEPEFCRSMGFLVIGRGKVRDLATRSIGLPRGESRGEAVGLFGTVRVRVKDGASGRAEFGAVGRTVAWEFTRTTVEEGTRVSWPRPGRSLICGTTGPELAKATGEVSSMNRPSRLFEWPRFGEVAGLGEVG